MTAYVKIEFYLTVMDADPEIKNYLSFRPPSRNDGKF